MSNTHSTSPERPYFIIVIAVSICVILPLVVSSQQAGQFFKSLGTGTNAYIMFGAACAIIFSSPVIAALMGHAVKTWHKVIALSVCAGIIFFSIITTTVAINTNAGAKIAREVQTSHANQNMQLAINGNLATIASLQTQIDARDPIRWATKRSQWATQIQTLQMQNMQLMRDQQEHSASGIGSATGETFATLEKYSGISRFGFAVFAATLLDLIPFAVCLIIGGIYARSKGRGYKRDERYERDNADRYSFELDRGDHGKKHQPREAA